MTEGKLCPKDGNVAQNGFSEAISSDTISPGLKNEVQNRCVGALTTSGNAVLGFIWEMSDAIIRCVQVFNRSVSPAQIQLLWTARLGRTRQQRRDQRPFLIGHVARLPPCLLLDPEPCRLASVVSTCIV